MIPARRLAHFMPPCFIPCLRITKSSTLLLAPVLASTQQVSIEVIENVTDIFFPKWALLERCYTAHLDLKRVKHDWNKNRQGLRPLVNCVEDLSDDTEAGSGASQREPEVVVWV